jgi:hypothetical protein
MQDQPTQSEAGAELDQLERVVLRLLLETNCAGLWSVTEVAQAIRRATTTPAPRAEPWRFDQPGVMAAPALRP